MYGRSCDPECRGKLVDVMLSTYGEAQGDYDEALRKLVQLSRGEAGPAMAQLHARLLWCQVDADDLVSFRDRVLVPLITDALTAAKPDAQLIEDLVGLIALVPEPAATADPKAQDRWKKVIAALSRGGDRVQRALATRRAASARERANPPPMIKKVNFCNAAAAAFPTTGIETP